MALTSSAAWENSRLPKEFAACSNEHLTLAPLPTHPKSGGRGSSWTSKTQLANPEISYGPTFSYFFVIFYFPGSPHPFIPSSSFSYAQSSTEAESVHAAFFLLP